MATARLRAASQGDIATLRTTEDDGAIPQQLATRPALASSACHHVEVIDGLKATVQLIVQPLNGASSFLLRAMISETVIALTKLLRLKCAPSAPPAPSEIGLLTPSKLKLTVRCGNGRYQMPGGVFSLHASGRRLPDESTLHQLGMQSGDVVRMVLNAPILGGVTLREGQLTKEPLHGHAFSHAHSRYFVLTDDALE